MNKFKIRTLAGGGVAVFVGGSVTTFEIKDLQTNRSEYFTLAGADFGFGFKGGSSGPSSWTEFTASCSLESFHGMVIVTSIGGSLGGGLSAMKMDFVTGPAAGTSVKGMGWSTGLGASLTSTYGWMKRR